MFVNEELDTIIFHYENLKRIDERHLMEVEHFIKISLELLNENDLRNLDGKMKMYNNRINLYKSIIDKARKMKS